jgi:hypothetical protein
MDKRITLEKQLDEDVGPIVVMNKFNVDPQLQILYDLPHSSPNYHR